MLNMLKCLIWIPPSETRVCDQSRPRTQGQDKLPLWALISHILNMMQLFFPRSPKVHQAFLPLKEWESKSVKTISNTSNAQGNHVGERKHFRGLGYRLNTCSNVYCLHIIKYYNSLHAPSCWNVNVSFANTCK